ncbi:Utp21 specific WD40 associated putative domain-containing protein [Lipomyces arxii]|uniref:Utp21 specific WD40 associated putative domain-containing protein n=1 Tax=Lipomyces arxii TaxID=56418 RepID=UPI0034CEA1CC
MPLISIKNEEHSKKIRLAGLESHKTASSRIFSPFRALGHVTNSVPFSVSNLGQKFIITTCVGTAFQIYDAGNLQLLFVSSPPTSSPITAISTHFHFVYAIWGKTVGVFRRGKLVYTVESPSDAYLTKLLLFGDFICVSTDSTLEVFRFTSNDKSVPPVHYTTIILPPGAGDVVELVHPHTYLNKIVVATQSYLHLYNVRTGTLVFQSSPFSSLLTAISVAPVLDTFGLAFADGVIKAYDIRRNMTLFELNCKQQVTSISFRTDGNAHLVVGTVDGDLYFYDLNRRRRIHILRDVHSAAAGVKSVQFLNGQPVFITSGGDNSIKEFVFDPELSTSSAIVPSPPRLLRSRAGHSQPPTNLLFSDPDGHFLLSSSLDKSLWLFSLRKDAQTHELSQREKASGNKRKSGLTTGMKDKFPEITAIAYEANKAENWESVVTAHAGQNFARTWDVRKGIVGRWELKTADKTVVSAVGVSFCGNFGLVGSAGGSVEVYNLQSGIRRKRFRSHVRAVTGVAVDGLNKTIVSCGVDGELHFHAFKTVELKYKLHLSAPATKLLLHRSTELLAVSLSNNVIIVVDIVTMRIVRELKGHTDTITAFDFSADGRWIVSAAKDGTLRTWDLPTGSLIDVVKVPSVITALRLSGTSEYLATAHESGVGINLWSNRTVFKQVSFKQITADEIATIELPSIAGSSTTVEYGDDEDEVDDVSGTYVSPEQLSAQLVTVSLGPRNRFLSLLNMDVIKQRNKPVEPPKAPAQAPFFLSLTGQTEVKTEVKSHRRDVESLSVFKQKLIEGHAISDYSGFISHLKSLSPAATDLEIRALDGLEVERLVYFVTALTDRLRTRQDYDLVQAWMSMFLKIHGDVIVANIDTVREALEEWDKVEKKEKERVEELVGYVNGVSSFLRID